MAGNKKEIEKGTIVTYKGKEYVTGNCRQGLVELYKKKSFAAIVSVSEVKKLISIPMMTNCSHNLLGEDGDI